MDWVITLIVAPEQTILERILQIISYLIKRYPKLIASLSEFDGYGTKGEVLAQILDVNRNCLINISQELLVEIFKENGQLLEMNLNIQAGNDKFQIIVSDGSLIDVLGKGEMLPVEATGEYQNEDISNFKF